MKKLRFTRCFAALTVGLTTLPISADTVKTKDGKTYTGRITKETPTAVTIEVQAGKGIIEDVVVPIANTVSVVKTGPDELEALEIAKLVPTPDLLSDLAYKDAITTKLAPFARKHPTSKFKKDVDDVLKIYTEELKQVTAGAKKIDGRWVSPEELKWNDYNIQATLLYKQFTQLLAAKENKTMDAYRVFGELESKYVASPSYAQAVPAAMQALEKISADLDLAIKAAPIKRKEQLEMLKSQTPDERLRTETLIKNQEAEMKAKVMAENKARVPITSFRDTDVGQLNNAKGGATREKARLSKLKVEDLTAAAESFAQALKDSANGGWEAAKVNFAPAAKLHVKDPTVKQLFDRAKTAADAALKASGNASAAATPTITAPKAADPNAPKVAPKTPAGTDKTQAAPKQAMPEIADIPEEKSNTPMYLMGGAGVLVILGLIAKMTGKKSAE
jgi:hypothetical protein